MANQEHLDLLKQGVEAWNQWRKEHPDSRPDLRGADLRRTLLSHAALWNADFTDADLMDADLVETIFWDADFRGADLRGADLRGAKLGRTDLRGTDLRGAKLMGADLRDANLSHAILSGADLSGAGLVRTNLENASLTNCSIYGISVWDVYLEGARQENLVITPPNQPTITVDNLEIAQLIYLLLNYKKLRGVLNAVTERGVLILGRFGGGGLEVLQAIAAKLREAKYLPIIFDFERPQNRNYTETVKTLAGLARFIIADLSGPSVPQELYATVPHYKIPFVPIIEASKNSFSMAADLLEYPWVVRPPVTFNSIEELIEVMPSKIIAPAEEKYQARQNLLDELFNKT